VPWLRRSVAGLSPLRSAFDPGPVRVGFVVDSLMRRHVSFRPHRTSVFPPNCRSASAADYAEGRAGEIWESSNKQCPVGYRGSVGRRSTFTLLFVSSFSVLLVGFFLISCSLLSLQHPILCLSPIPLFYRHVSLVQPFGHCTYCQQCCVAHLLCISNKVFASSACQHSMPIIREAHLN
jgi:hypothetical protein